MASFLKAILGKADKTSPADPAPNAGDPTAEGDPGARVRLNVGGAKGHPKMDGWTVVDLRGKADVALDITADPLPYPDDSVDVVFCSHTLEHILPEKLGFVLREFLRVVKPASRGGIVRIAVPDIEKAVRAYAARDLEFFRKGDLTYAEPDAPLGGLLANWFYSISSVGNGHVHCFDFDYMKWLLEREGFADVRRSEFRRSALPELRAEGLDVRPHESLYVEARKNG